MTSADTRRIARIVIGSFVGGIALAGVAVPVASAAPDCSPAAVDNSVSNITQQAQDYLNDHPAGNAMLMKAVLQPRPQAEQTLRNYATTNPAEYAGFKAILAPLGTLQQQCGVQVVPSQFQWAFNQFISG